MEHDKNNPNPFLALFLDRSIPFNLEAKAAFLRDSSSKSRQFLLPIIKPFARLAIALIQLFRIFIPNIFTSSKWLHRFLYWGMKYFISPDANYLILRHFYLGSEILAFIHDNVPDVEVEMNPLKPTNLEPVKDDLFLVHDLNLYNFIIHLNQELVKKGQTIKSVKKANFDSITSDPIPIEQMPNRWTNVFDLTTAIELFTPVYQLFLTDNDFWRASNSLQLDETVGLYAATILNEHQRLSLVNNKHPMVPLTTVRAGFRLILHGLATEQLHALLVEGKRQQEKKTHVS